MKHGKYRGCCADPEELFESNEDHLCFSPSKLQNAVKLHGLKIAHQNIQSLVSKINHLCLLLCEELNCGMSETWIKQDVSDVKYAIPGYKLFRKEGW